MQARQRDRPAPQTLFWVYDIQVAGTILADDVLETYTTVEYPEADSSSRPTSIWPVPTRDLRDIADHDPVLED